MPTLQVVATLGSRYSEVNELRCRCSSVVSGRDQESLRENALSFTLVTPEREAESPARETL